MDEVSPVVATAALPRWRQARWIVGGTLAGWVVFSVVIWYVAATASDDGEPASLAGLLLLFAALPGIPAIFLYSLLHNAGEIICGSALGILFVASEILAWVRRIEWFAWALLGWLFVNMGVMTVIFFMARMVPVE